MATKRSFFKYDEEIIYDILIEIGEQYFNEPYNSSIELYGDKKVNAIVLMSLVDDDSLFEIDKSKLIEDLDYSEIVNNKFIDFSLNNNIKILKLEHDNILKLITEYLADDNYNGEYLAKIESFGTLKENFRFIVVIGDEKDTDIENLDLCLLDKKMSFN